ncbi:MAG: cyclic nucleotide-binding protein [Deltaproteobacteria bacterium]|nr:MAG: cyclic nucleotide-binding protein [Deltaproteobacteria bacterium]
MSSNPIKAHDIKRFDTLRPLSPEGRDVLAGHLTRERFEQGEKVATAGEVEPRMHFILEGEAAVKTDGVTLRPLAAGEHFGELGLVSDVARTASVVARGPLEVATLTKASLDALTEHSPRVALSIERMLLRGLSDKLGLLTEDIRDLLSERSVPRHLTVSVEVGGTAYEVPTGTVVRELLPTRIEDRLVVAALLDRRAKSLTHRLTASACLEPLTTAHWEGQRVYQRSLGLLLVEAARGVDPELSIQLGHSVGLGQRVHSEGGAPWRPKKLAKELSREMHRLAEEDAQLREEWWMVTEAQDHLRANGWNAAAMYLDGHYDPAVRLVSYGKVYALRPAPFLAAASMMKHFDVIADDRGLLLVFGSEAAKVGTFSMWPGKKEALTEVRLAAKHTGKMTAHHARWLSTLGVDSVGAFNDACVSGDVSQLIRVAEGFQEKQLSSIADSIGGLNGGVKVICIAGPSSSGKTTFIRRLTVQLQVNGVTPVGVGLDDYYIDRDDTPRDESGEFNFEAFEALQTDLLADHVNRLLKGETVKTARYDFHEGKSHPEGGEEMTLGRGQVLILEGIHGLNPRLLEAVADDRQYRIFICPLAQLPIDRVSRVHASDLRLLRRIVRDRHGRGHNAAATIARWPSVRRGERKNIFPYQDLADAVFDTSLIYELSVLRVFAERYLREVPRGDPSYPTAHRLLTMLSRFIAIYPDHVPPTSILREFIGGSGFEF